MNQRQDISPVRFPERLTGEANRLKLRLKEELSPRERDRVTRRLRQMETAAQIDEWISSPGLQPPK